MHVKLASSCLKYRVRDEIQSSLQPARRKSMWEEYRAEREIYIRSKSRAIRELKARQKQERENLYWVQKSRLTEIFSENWKGRGGELSERTARTERTSYRRNPRTEIARSETFSMCTVIRASCYCRQSSQE